MGASTRERLLVRVGAREGTCLRQREGPLGSRARAQERGRLFALAQALVCVSARGHLAHGRERKREAACLRRRKRGHLFAPAQEAAWLTGRERKREAAHARERGCLIGRKEFLIGPLFVGRAGASRFHCRGVGESSDYVCAC